MSKPIRSGLPLGRGRPEPKPESQPQLEPILQPFVANDAPLDLQFGMELEFLAPGKVPAEAARIAIAPSLRDRMAHDGAFHHYADALQKAGLPAAFFFVTTPREFPRHPLRHGVPSKAMIKEMRVMDPSTVSTDGMHHAYKYWVLKPETDLSAEGAFTNWIPLELNTPILTESEAKNGFPNLNKALQVISDASSEGIHINKTCGMHVHVSSQEHEGFSLIKVKQIVSLVMLIEDQVLYNFCSPARREKHYTMIPHAMFSTQSYMFGSGGRMVDLPPLTDEERKKADDASDWIPFSILNALKVPIDRIWGAVNAEDLSLLIDSEHTGSRLGTALAMKFHYNPDASQPYTVEFRYAQASIDKDFVGNWIELVLMICKAATQSLLGYRDVMRALWGEVSTPTDQTWQKILAILGLYSGAGSLGPASRVQTYWSERLKQYTSHPDPDFVPR